MQRRAGGLRQCGRRRADHLRLYGHLRRLVVHLYGGGALQLCILHHHRLGLYGSRCIEFLFHTDKVVGPFLVVYSFVSILGATVDLGLLWSIADTFNGLMSIPNLMALLLLSGTVAKLTKEFFAGEGAGK